MTLVDAKGARCFDIYRHKFFHRKDGVRTGAYSRSSNAQARAAAADRNTLEAVAVVGAPGPPGFELLMDPVEIIPAEQEFSVVTTEKKLVADTAVLLRVTPVKTKVCVPDAAAVPVYVKS